METRCSICGCITDTAELNDVTLSGENFSACPFCNKKLKQIEKDPLSNSQLAREILQQDTKGRRSAQCNAMLYRHFYSLGIKPTENVSNVSTQPVNKNNPATPQNADLQKEVAELKKQVEEITSSLKKFKRRYYLSRILGVIAPVVLTLIMLLIFLKMGFLDKLFEYYDFLGKYASM